MTVVSFNVRYGTADDGPDSWEHRKALVLRNLRALDADLIGTQEMLAFQSDYLEAGLTAYTRVGAGRVDGAREGEMTAVYFRRSRFRKIDEGHFWLSETPDVVGSKGWDAQLPRVATWVLLEDRIDSRRLYFLDTHFSHVGAVARRESARLIRERAEDADAPAIVTGDFNAEVDSEVYEQLTSSLVDTYRALYDVEPPGTIHTFDTDEVGTRIDWILADEAFEVLEAGIDRARYDGRWPSDHHAVTAKIIARPRP